LQDVRRHQPSTVSRRLSVVVGFYRVCHRRLLPHSPADYVRRPTVPAESPTLGLGHLQFEALITTARLSTNPNDFALVALLGLLGLRIFEACAASIADLGEEHGHRVLRIRGKGGKVVLVPLPPAVARAIDRAVDDRADGPILRNSLGVRMDRHAATRRLKHLAASAGIRMPRMHPHMRHTFVTTMLDAGVKPARRTDRRPPRRPTNNDALRPGPQEPRPPPQLHPRRVHGIRNVTAVLGFADVRAVDHVHELRKRGSAEDAEEQRRCSYVEWLLAAREARDHRHRYQIRTPPGAMRADIDIATASTSVATRCLGGSAR
jgi:hypothetical protein